MTVADALEEAQQKIADLLQHPDDLNTKLSQLRQKFTSEKASIDAILKTSVQSQLDDIQDGMGILTGANETLLTIRSNLETIDKVSLDPKSAIANYPKIKKISRTHQNFVATRDVVVKFQALSKEIDQISQMLDQHVTDILGEAPQLLFIHMELYRLEEFREESLHKAKSQGPAVLSVVSKYFRKLDTVSEKFREYLWTLTVNMVELIKENQGGVVVRLMKIIEVEEKADENVLANEHIRSSNPNLKSSSEWKVLAENPRQIKNYRSQMFNALLESIHKKFYSVVSAAEQDCPAALEACQFVFEDLSIVRDEIVPRCPQKYKIFNFFVLQYHKQVYDLLNRLSGRKLETRDILFMTGWVRDYYRIMNDQFGVTEDELEPRLLDDNEQALIAEYVKLIREKLDEWIGRLLETDRLEFVTRDKPPETDTEGMYQTSAPVILFNIINQQIDIAVDAAKGGRLLLDVTIECFQALVRFQEKQLKMLETEETRFLNYDPSTAVEEMPGGFPEYVIAFSNNHLKCTEYVELLQKRLDAVLSEKFRADASKHLSEALDGFMRVAKRGYLTLINIIFKDISFVFSQLFTPPWYDSKLMFLIVNTLEDYLQDFRKHLQDYLFTKLTSDCLDKFLIHYLEAFKAKSVKFKMPQAAELMKGDIVAAEHFWTEYKAEKRVKQSFDLVNKLLALLESSSSMIFLSWYAIWKVYNDVPMQFIEDTLYKRSDLDKASIKEAIANCKVKAKEGNPEATSSIFSKIESA
ncbi:hypothetical protein MP638_001595 [Amoeboaphelidium occidentale]|nr:hypothetical protein MP638_001595 [Amoeboaphelidium occidentale]